MTNPITKILSYLKKESKEQTEKDLERVAEMYPLVEKTDIRHYMSNYPQNFKQKIEEHRKDKLDKMLEDELIKDFLELLDETRNKYSKEAIKYIENNK